VTAFGVRCEKASTHRTQCRERVSQALERVCRAARARKEERFTALLQHINVDLLRLSFYALKRTAAPRVDGLTSLTLGRPKHTPAWHAHDAREPGHSCVARMT
jgi:hypothetical protein